MYALPAAGAKLEADRITREASATGELRLGG